MIWWCAQHKQAGDEYGCQADNETCSSPMVEALLIVKENGEWPAWAMACATQGWYAPTPSKQALIVLDALASVGGDSQ